MVKRSWSKEKKVVKRKEGGQKLKDEMKGVSFCLFFWIDALRPQ